MVAHRPVRLQAVLFDLDDTLYPQSDYLAGAWQAVAETAAPGAGRSVEAIRDALERVASLGSDRGRIIDRALEQLGVVAPIVEPLVEVFRSYAPDRLEPYPGVVSGLASLRRVVPVGLVSDGDVGIQRAKLHALDLEEAFDVVVFSDGLGRAHRKPDPEPFRIALATLGVAAEESVYIGDRPDKDVVGATAAGLGAVRVRTGEYRDRPNTIAPWADLADVAAAITWLDVNSLPAAPLTPERSTRPRHPR